MSKEALAVLKCRQRLMLDYEYCFGLVNQECPHCGAKIDDDAKFCTECGKKILTPEPEAKSNEKKKTPGWVILLIVLFGGLALIFILAMVLPLMFYTIG